MSGTLGNTEKKAPMSEANMKRAERFNLANHGPPKSAEEQLEAKKRKMESLAKNLEIGFGFDEVRVVPSLELLKPVT